MADNSQGRKWQLTLNNFEEHNITIEMIREQLKKFVPDYYCLCQEIGNETHTKHMHIFIYSKSPIRFSTLKNRFPIAHIEKSFGSVKENVDYIKKEGRFADTDKSETTIEGSIEEYGVMPDEKEVNNPTMYHLLEDIKDGKTTMQIVEENPSLAFKIKDIETIRQTYLAEKYSKENRDLTVTYLFGATQTGKTRSIYEHFGAENISRITNYSASRGVIFDDYRNATDVIVFEEFSSQIPIEAMLNYLDIYPLMLPCRYNDKVACYTHVIITSNLPLESQYPELRLSLGKIEKVKAFERRIHNVIEFKRDGTKVEHKITKREEVFV